MERELERKKFVSGILDNFENWFCRGSVVNCKITISVPDAYYSTKFSFGANKGSQFDSASNSVVEPGISRLDLTKPYAQHPKHYSPTLKQSEPLECISRKETRSKRLSDDVVIIKSEIDESNRVLDGELDRDDGGGERRGDCDKRKNGLSHGLKSETDSTTIQGDQTNEPDSTECRISNKNHGTEGEFIYFISFF